MGGRSKTIPEDAKTRFASDSSWARFPRVFAGIGVACLLLAGVLGTSGSGSHGGDHHGAAAADQTEAHGEGGAAGDAHGGADDRNAAADSHGAPDSHDSAAHGAAPHGAADEADHGSDAHAEDEGHGHAEDAAPGGHDGAHEAEGGHGGGHGSGVLGHRFYFSFLTAYMFGLSLALGGLFFVAIQFLTKAGWSVVVRRIAENVMGTMPLFAILFVLLIFGFSDTHAHWWSVAPGSDELLDAKSPYLNKPFFFFRAIVYFACWIGLARYFRNLSIQQDDSADQDITRKLQKAAPVAIIVFALTVTFAAIDWMKSMDPHWYSTMWGVYYFAGCLVGIFSLLAVLVLWTQGSGYLKKVITEEHYHDIGKQMFGFNVFWTYIAFSQYFLIWYANIPEEHLWFEHRSHGGWGEYGIFLGVGHFFIPFFFLLPRAIKRNPVTLFIGAAWLLFIHYVDIYFIVMPVHSHTFEPSLVDVLALAGVVALFVAWYARLASKAELVPRGDPRLPESLAFENF